MSELMSLTGMSRLCLLTMSVLGSSAWSSRPPTTSSAREAATTTQPADAERAAEVRRLIGELREARYSVREAAQRQLAAMGESALPWIVPYLDDPDAEVSRRVAEVVGTPRDPAVRVAAALKLLSTTDPDWMERAVQMLFDDPVAVADEFDRQSRGASGFRTVVFAPIAERLSAAKKRHAFYARRYERLIREKPDAAEKERKMNEETDLYDAEAAYWSAYEALLEYQEKHGRASESPPAATSRDATPRSSP